MVREGLSHEGNLLSSFAHSSILACFPAQLDGLSLRHSRQPSCSPLTRDADSVCLFITFTASVASSMEHTTKAYILSWKPVRALDRLVLTYF